MLLEIFVFALLTNGYFMWIHLVTYGLELLSVWTLQFHLQLVFTQVQLIFIFSIKRLYLLDQLLVILYLRLQDLNLRIQVFHHLCIFLNSIGSCHFHKILHFLHLFLFFFQFLVHHLLLLILLETIFNVVHCIIIQDFCPTLIVWANEFQTLNIFLIRAWNLLFESISIFTRRTFIVDFWVTLFAHVLFTF